MVAPEAQHLSRPQRHPKVPLNVKDSSGNGVIGLMQQPVRGEGQHTYRVTVNGVGAAHVRGRRPVQLNELRSLDDDGNAKRHEAKPR